MRIILSIFWLVLAAAWISGISVIARSIGGYQYILHRELGLTVGMLTFMATLCVASAIMLTVTRQMPRWLWITTDIAAGIHFFNVLVLASGSMLLLIIFAFIPTTTMFVGIPSGNMALFILPVATIVVSSVSVALSQKVPSSDRKVSPETVTCFFLSALWLVLVVGWSSAIAFWLPRNSITPTSVFVLAMLVIMTALCAASAIALAFTRRLPRFLWIATAIIVSLHLLKALGICLVYNKFLLDNLPKVLLAIPTTTLFVGMPIGGGLSLSLLTLPVSTIVVLAVSIALSRGISLSDRETSIETVEFFVQQSLERLKIQTSGHMDTWRLGKEKTWAVDQDQGLIRFLFADGVVATAPVQIIGTYNSQSGIFLWAWDHPSVVEPLRRVSALVRDYGIKHKLGRFTERKIKCTEAEAWEFTAVAASLDSANGGYRAKSGANKPLIYVTFGEVKLAKQPT